MTAPFVDRPKVPELGDVSFQTQDYRRVIDCSLPTAISSLRAHVSHLDPVTNDLSQVPLEVAFRGWLRERLPEKPVRNGGRLEEVLVDAVVAGKSGTPTPHRLIVVPHVPFEQIPDRSGDPAGCLKRLEPWIDDAGVVVLFSSPDKHPQHHSRMWSYALGWPHHVELFSELADYRRRENLPPFEESSRRLDLRWVYDRRCFHDARGGEHWAHLLTAGPRAPFSNAAEAISIGELRASELFRARLVQIAELGAQEVVTELLTELEEYRRGIRLGVSSVQDIAAKFDIDRAIVYEALAQSVPESILVELRAAVRPQNHSLGQHHSTERQR